MHGLIAAQVAFCFVVHFVAGLFVVTFERLSNQPTGLFGGTDSQSGNGDEPAAAAGLLVPRGGTPAGGAGRRKGGDDRLAADERGERGGKYFDGWRRSQRGLCGFLSVSPGWMDVMKVRWIDGSDFRPEETAPGFAIVNQAFAKQYFNGKNPVGKSFDRVERVGPSGERARVQIVGLVRDARSRDSKRLPIRPMVYWPFQASDGKGGVRPIGRGTFVVRASGSNPLALASALRQEVPRARPGFRVSNIRTQAEIDEASTVRERLLAMLALFFAVVALLLAGIGLYGVLDYSVLQRRREIGIRMAIGARGADIARGVTRGVFTMVLVGAAAGLGLGMASVRYIESLFYQVKATDAGVLALPSLTILLVALAAAVPPVIRALRIDPSSMLRAE